ncbi:unnamed protein product [Aspergillus oryzae RIB40]|uniref:DNA, SC023 n=1 Tax=Aspergillus oryzae (strain ATCC 42149 / RIB 40) TaxID=510516 RepID=Q2UGY5_ASPOR|nr:unnamed protein product [Aspergillus oryzae RIB40]BAE59180.1 unnamed protein product [Aspergillus oryzae RIB40]
MTVFGFYAMLVTDTRAAVMAMRGHWRLFSSAKRTNAAVYVAIVQMAQTSGGTQHVINQLLGCTGALPVTRGIKGACQKLQIRLPNLHYASAAVNQILKTGTCELCRTKYAKMWWAGCKSSECGPDELTYQEYREKVGNATMKPEFFAYLKRAHGIDRSAAAVVEAKQLEDALNIEG